MDKLHLMHPYWWRVVYRRCPQWASPHVLNFILILNICVGYPIDISTITRTLPTIPECLESYSYLNFAAKPTATPREFIKNEKQAIFVSLISFIFKASKPLISWLDPIRLLESLAPQTPYTPKPTPTQKRFNLNKYTPSITVATYTLSTIYWWLVLIKNQFIL